MADNVLRRRRLKIIQFLFLVDDLEDEKGRNRERIIWTRSWIRRREERGVYHQLIRELALEDEPAFARYFRMEKNKFDDLVGRIAVHIERQPTIMRTPISPGERLAVTLRYLATGETFSSLESQFRISRTAISEIIFEVCDVIFSVIGPEFLKVPNSSCKWLEISSKFESQWNFPNGLFAVDGKRVIIQQPPNSGSHYYDYKGHNSILAMVAVGPDYEILAADVGMNGRMSDGGNWSRNRFRKMLADNSNPLNVPQSRPLPGRSINVPYVAVGDDAFPLTTYLLKPFPMSSLTSEQRIFNYRLSRMRRISENVLGIMAQKWRVLRNAMLVGPEKATTIVLAIMTLHNYLRSDKHYRHAGAFDDEKGGTEGSWRKEAPSTVSWLELPALAHGQNYSTNAKAVREEFCSYFNLEGAVSWQWMAARIDG